jgi:hypothetical protein
MGSCRPAATWAAIHSSRPVTVQPIARPVSSEASAAISANVGAAGAVSVVGPSYAPFDDGGGLGEVLARRPGHGTVGGYRHDAGLAPGAHQPVQAVRVVAVAQRRPGDAGPVEQPFGGGVVAPRRERGVERGALMARVQDPADSRLDRRVDRPSVQAHRVGRGVVRGDEEQLVGTVERGPQRTRVGVVAAAHLDAARREAPGPGGVARHDRDLVGGDAPQQVVDGRAVERSGGSGDDDHDNSPVIVGINITVSLETQRYQQCVIVGT